MRDQSLADNLRSEFNNAKPNSEFIEACKEYFEIAIGHRRPVESEKNEASRVWVTGGLLGKNLPLIDRVKALKYPIDANLKSTILTFILVEHEVFKILSKAGDFINGPYIPMLRYEIELQKSLFDDEEYEIAVIRQQAAMETIFRMKADLGWVDWKWSLLSAYRGEHIIDESTFYELRDFTDIRNNLAHSWSYYIASVKENEVHESAIVGLRVLSDILSQELYSTFKEYSSKHPTQRYSARFEDRATATFSGQARASVTTSCNNCGHTFNPQNHWKRCPSCDTSHGYWI